MGVVNGIHPCDGAERSMPGGSKTMRLSALVLVAVTLLGCRGGSSSAAAHGSAEPTTTMNCAAVGAHLLTFGELLEVSSADAKMRGATYAGLLELVLSLESAASTLEQDLRAPGATSELESALRRARTSLVKSAQFARTERDAIEKHAREITPLAKETQQAWTALRLACDGKKVPPGCSGVREAVAHFDAANTKAQHERAVAELVALRLPSPKIARSRDRAVAASAAVQTAIRSVVETRAPLPKRWAAVQKDLAGSMDGLGSLCRGETPLSAELVAAQPPDPRKLTVLVHVKPPAGVERALLALAVKARDEDEQAFYKARAEGAFGSGFFLVKKTDTGDLETLVLTNRHVVELGDRAALELADGTALGLADVVYANPSHDLAVLRPVTKLAATEGFGFARMPAKDQQTVIATGFPGLVGRPSYQTTKGYVSNESFRLDDGSRPLTYVQHTAPIDPGSSGGPLTDEAGHVLGVNTLKVTGREAVGLAVPARYVLHTIRTAGAIESRHADPLNRQHDARLACLGFLAELGTPEPRMLVLEQMISNHLVGVEGLDDAAALGSDEGFENLWNGDAVRAMRLATLVRVRAAFLVGGGPSVLETCKDFEAAAIRPDTMTFRIRLGNFEMREMALRWEHGRWKVDGFEAGGGVTKAGTARRLPASGQLPATPPGPRKVPPPRTKK